MKQFTTLAFCLSCSLFLRAQDTVYLDPSFKPVKKLPVYLAVTEKKGEHWSRRISHLEDSRMLRTESYSDQSLTTLDGEYRDFHFNGKLRSAGSYRSGRKNGTWLRYSLKSTLIDSTQYQDGIRNGFSIGYYETGERSDSAFFDRQGNGLETQWFKDGKVRVQGMWVSDSLKDGKWIYRYENGNQLAVQEYALGKLTGSTCYDSTGEIKTGDCEEREAVFNPKQGSWRRFMELNLRPDVPVKKGAPVGIFTVVVRFGIGMDGEIIDIEPLTAYGYGMEEELVRVIKKSPRWQPASQFGRNIKAYRLQPATFMVTDK